MNLPKDKGGDLHGWASDLFPICRSLTGNGVRETLSYLKCLLPEIKTFEIPSGTKVNDWLVPNEWNIKAAYIATLSGEKIIDFADSNLHVVGYSRPIDQVVSLESLKAHLHTLPDQPTAIPYVTSYYSENWGFCLPHRDLAKFTEPEYRVVIDSQLAPGSMTYAEVVVPGETEEEVLLSTYMCHPSMANNELSGPVVMTALGRWLLALPARKYTYRLLFLPETIGAISYISQNFDHLKNHVIAGWVLTCIGDERAYSFVPSRMGGTLADRVSEAVLENVDGEVIKYTYLDRGSDERQWCAPGVDLPVASLMRSKYGEFPEYHTSLDDLEFVTPSGLQGGLDMMVSAINILEMNATWKVTTLGEPQLGKRGLYPNISDKTSGEKVRDMMNVIAYSDGEHDALSIAELTGVPASVVCEISRQLEAVSLMEKRA